MRFKIFYNQFCATMVKLTVKRRLNQFHNNILVRSCTELVNLDQITPLQFATLNKAKEGIRFNSEESQVFQEKGYIDGLGYAKKLLEEDNYNIETLEHLMKLLANSCAYTVFGSRYATGFFNGLFGGDGRDDYMRWADHNWFTQKWRREVVLEF